MRLVVVLFTGPLMLHLVACSDNGIPSPEHQIATRDSAGIEIVTNSMKRGLAAWRFDAVPSLVVGGDASSTGAELFRAASATRLSNGQVVIGNSGMSQVLVFANDGSRPASFGRRGRGPGEFSGSPMRVLPSSGDTILMEDLGRPRRLLAFNLTGELQVETVLPAHATPRQGAWSDFATSPSGVGFGLGGPLPDQTPSSASPPAREPVSVVRFTYTGQGPDTIAVYPGTELFYHDVGPRPTLRGGSAAGPRAIAPLFQKTTRLSGGGQPWRVVVADQAVAAFDVYSQEGTLLRRVQWQPDRRSLSARDWELARAAFLESRRQDQAGARRSLEVMPTVEYAPVLDTLIVGRDNTVWVRRYVVPTDSSAQWWVFSDVGSLIASVQAPTDMQVLEVGADYMIGLLTDEFGTERIELRSIRHE